MEFLDKAMMILEGALRAGAVIEEAIERAINRIKRDHSEIDEEALRGELSNIANPKKKPKIQAVTPPVAIPPLKKKDK